MNNNKDSNSNASASAAALAPTSGSNATGSDNLNPNQNPASLTAIPADVLSGLTATIAQLQALMADLPVLTPKQRPSTRRFGRSALAATQRTLELALQRDGVIPRGLDSNELARGPVALGQLIDLGNRLRAVLIRVDDATAFFGAGLRKSARVLKSAMTSFSGENGSELHELLRRLPPVRRKAKPKSGPVPPPNASGPSPESPGPSSPPPTAHR